MQKATGYANPLLPNQVDPTSGVSAEMHQEAGPPSYEQATGSGNMAYPRMQMPTTQPPESFTVPNQSAFNPHFHQQHYAAAPGAGPAPHINISYPTQQGIPQVVQPNVVIIQQQAVLPLGPDPTYVTCPSCHIQKLTRIEYEPSSRTHLMAGLLCLLGFWCCVCLPYCAGSCMNTNHYCGNCNKFLGTYGNAF